MIKKIAYNNNISGPARINTLTRKLTINPKVWETLPDTFKKFVLLHEYGHLQLNTADELQADNYAFENLQANDPDNFRENVKIISSMLPFTTKGHFERIKNSYIKALEPGKNDPDILR
ncbi:MAG: hypothetical protein PHS33_08535, partial [Candidatus Omnitrophica bacterium]|nr:hypothetical protein [Candidatus Omnitrophota bacterium]